MRVNDDDFRSFFELSLDLFIIVDFAGGIVAINGAWKDVLDYETDDLLNRSLFDFVYKEDLSRTDVQMHRSAQGFDVTNFENRWVARDGSLRWLRWRSRVDHEKRLVFGVAVDITTEKAQLKVIEATQEELQTSLEKEIEAKENFRFHRERIESLFMQVPGLASVLRGPDHVFEFANDGYRKLFGPREIVGLSVKEVLPDLDSAISEILDNVFHKGERFVGNSIAINADWLGDGKSFSRVFDFIYEPIFTADRKPEGIWVWAIDVTEQKKLERDKRISDRMVSLGRLAAGIAHEINNPLSYALGNLELSLSNKDLNPTLKRRIETSIEGIERVATIVKGLRAFSRIDDAKFEKTNLKDEVTAALSIANHEIKRSQATVIVDSNSDINLWAPRGAIFQIMMNLVVNSAHATSKSSKKEIRIRLEELSNLQIQLVVEDTGSGIDQKLIDSIFDPFVTTKDIGQGTGLGLSIVHGLVTNLNGTISVTSKVGDGTTVRILLPKNAPRIADASAESNLPTKTVRKILVIDDEAELRNVIKVSSLDFVVETFERINEAVASYKSNRDSVGAILCDLSLQGESGKDLYDLLAAKWPGDESKVVFMTGGVTRQDIADWLDTIPNKVLKKPFRMQELVRALKEKPQQQ